MKWLLIFWLSNAGGISADSVEFFDEDRCNAAAQALIEERVHGVGAICVPMGEAK